MGINKYKYTKKNSFIIDDVKTNDKGEFANREDAVEEFVGNLKEINLLQQKLYAERKEGVVFVFQAMDAAGKDGCIRTVFGTLTPHGVNEFCFKAPSTEELSHDYLWRFWKALPARGNISIFNRSYYEDVLVGKVHKLYENQVWPDRMKNRDVIKKRYQEINDFERYLYNNATRVVKIFLNVSKKEQAKRFISRIDTPRKNWKISEGDIKEREFWDEYQQAFEDMINATSTKTSPWYVVPADHKWYARLIVSRIVLNTLKEIDAQFPVSSDEEREKIREYRATLLKDLGKETKSIEKNEKEKADTTKCEKEMEEDAEKSGKEHKKHKKHKKNKKEKKNKEHRQPHEGTLIDELESVFVDASIVVTDIIIEDEQEKVTEKSKVEEKDTVEAVNAGVAVSSEAGNTDAKMEKSDDVEKDKD